MQRYSENATLGASALRCIKLCSTFQVGASFVSLAPTFQPRPACAGLASDDENGSDLNCLAAQMKSTPFGVLFLLPGEAGFEPIQMRRGGAPAVRSRLAVDAMESAGCLAATGFKVLRCAVLIWLFLCPTNHCLGYRL